MDISFFRIFDENNDGNITFNEFKKIWSNLGIERTEEELKQLFNDIDINNNDKIDYSELKMYIDKNYDKNDIDSINNTFSIIDNNQNREISLFELEKIIDKLNLDISFDYLKTCFYKHDFDKNHKINLLEFSKIITNSHTNMSVFSIVGNLINFIDQSEANIILKTKTQVEKKQLLNDYRWIKNFEPFNILSRSRIYFLLKNSKKDYVCFNQKLIKRNQLIENIYVIYSGEFKITKSNKKIPSDILLINSGRIIGIEDSFYHERYQYNIVSTCSGIVLVIPKIDFFRMLDMDKKFLKKLVSIHNSQKQFIDKRLLTLDSISEYLNNQLKIEDKFKYTRGIISWLDKYPLKIYPKKYKFKIKQKSTINNYEFKKPYKSKSKLGKFLDKHIILFR